MSFEVLDFALMLFGVFEGVESAQAASLSSDGVFLSGIESRILRILIS